MTSTPPRNPMSPPLNVQRKFSTTSTSASLSPVLGSDRKRRNRALLRDYYGIGGNTAEASPGTTGGGGGGGKLDIDSPKTFSPELYFENLSTTASVPDLLKRENELLNEIRELDGERQSLVYNHHHELIEASDTIRKVRPPRTRVYLSKR
ncbi:hypothetical protein MNV49_007747 [Pseudohyphozyma bogoriensis]|nr:hypothetical protein MNV49_007747 [Pseudohyphozyma bogoriensis]